jgi:hypothetical protein
VGGWVGGRGACVSVRVRVLFARELSLSLSCVRVCVLHASLAGGAKPRVRTRVARLDELAHVVKRDVGQVVACLAGGDETGGAGRGGKQE